MEPTASDLLKKINCLVKKFIFYVNVDKKILILWYKLIDSFALLRRINIDNTGHGRVDFREYEPDVVNE